MEKEGWRNRDLRHRNGRWSKASLSTYTAMVVVVGGVGVEVGAVGMVVDVEEM